MIKYIGGYYDKEGNNPTIEIRDTQTEVTSLVFGLVNSGYNAFMGKIVTVDDSDFKNLYFHEAVELAGMGFKIKHSDWEEGKFLYANKEAQNSLSYNDGSWYIPRLSEIVQCKKWEIIQ
jgi:hypothetical protein